MYSRKVGLLASAILATSCLNLIVASINILDMALTLFMTACMVFFYAFERTEKKKWTCCLLYRHGLWCFN